MVKAGGKVLGGVKLRSTRRTSPRSCYRRRLQSQGHRACQCRRRHHQRDQAGGRIRTNEERRPKVSPLLAFVTDIDSVGLETAQGLLLTEAFYWDLNDETRAWSKRFMERVKRVPTAAQAGVYSSVDALPESR